jgi:hypothetical protein
MAASGNSIALKSFQSFAVNEGLLAKVVEAVKAGEKEARTSGDIKSFEVFYKGFRQNIAIGRIYIVPVKVCNNFKNFPISLLYGTVVRELNLGEEVADLIEKKIGETEFDEYSQLDVQRIKDTLFKDAESEEYRSLVLFAPNWSNIREYIVFKFTGDDEKLSNLLRHQIFSAYFNPAVSGAFDALMTNVDTNKMDLTDITPKLTYPFITENPLKAYPDLQKTGGWSKPKVFLTAKTADAITKEVLDPQELNVFEALDSALTEVTMPETQGMDEVADFKGPDGSNHGNAETPQIDGEQPTTADLKDDSGASTGLRRRPDYGEKDSFTSEMNEANSKGASAKTAKFDYSATNCPDCGNQLDAFKTCPAADAKSGRQFCGKGKEVPNLHLWGGGGGSVAPKKGIQNEQQPARTMVGSTKKADTADNPANEKGGAGAIEVKTDKEIAVTAGFDRNATVCPDCGKELDGFKICRDAKGGGQFCGVQSGAPSPNLYLGDFYKDAPQKGIQREPNASRRVGSAKTAEVDMGQVPSQQDRADVKPSDKTPVNTVTFRAGAAGEGKGIVFGYHMPTGHFGKRELKFEWPIEEATYRRMIKPFVDRKDSNGAFDAFQKLTGGKMACAPFETPFTNVGPGTAAHDNAEKAIAVKVDTISQKGDVEANSPIGIELDETGLPVHEKIAREIWRGVDDNGGYVAMSTKAKAAADKREAELDKKYAGRKKADVALTEESIWAGITEEFGEAPQVELPGEGDSKPTESLPETMTSEKPEEAKAVTEKEIDKAEPKSDRPKSKMFGKGEGDNKEEPKEEKKEETKEASSKTALLYMNDYDIQMAQQILGSDPVLGPAIRFLNEFRNEVNEHSDGWAYWSAPLKAAAQLMTLIQTGVNARREGKAHGVTVDNLKRAMAPIKAFMTRRGLAAGMQMPKLAVKKNAAEIQPDMAEAKSEVVSPDTVDADIKQPTESVEEAAKFAAVERTGDTNATEQYAGEHGCRTYENGKVCMKPEAVIHDGRKYCEKHRPSESKKKKADLGATSKGRGFGNYVRGEEIHDFTNVHTGDLLLEHSNQFDADNTILVSKDEFPEAPNSRIWAHFVNPEDWEERWGEDFCIWAHELGNKKTGIELWRAGNTPEFSEADKIGLNGLGVTGSSKKKADVSSDISEAKSEVVSPDTVDSDIKQSTESVEQAAKVAYGEETVYSPDTLQLAQRLIDSGDDIAYDVAANDGQIFDNVKGMEWFVKAVAEEIAGNEDTVREYLDNEPFLTRMEHGVDYSGGVIAAAGDENDEAVEMGLGDGDLADPAANLPKVTAASKTAEAYYTSRNFKTKKDLAQAVANGKQITVYDPGQGMGGEAEPPLNGTVSVAGPHYPEPHRWYSRVTLSNGIIVGVK